MSTRHKLGDSLSVNVTVRNTQTGAVTDVSGATLDAAIRSPAGAITTITASLVTDGTDGRVNAFVPTATIDAVGIWLLEVEAVIGTQSQTVYQEKFNVREALLTD